MEEDIVNKDCYYKKEADNEFNNYTIHGLNIEGIKKYCLIPINKKYDHMVQLKKDLNKVIENSKILEQERRKKYDRNFVYDDDRLIKMYSKENFIKNFDNKQRFNSLQNKNIKNKEVSKSTKIIEMGTKKERPIEIKIDENNNKTIKEELKQHNTINTINNDNCVREKIFSKYKIKKYSNSLHKRTNLNKSYGFKRLNKSKMNDVGLPFIRPRKIIIEYNLTNDAGIESEKKNLGHNNYMGGSFNPFNYSVNPKNRNKRNVYGNLFLH
jgi:hypothetical protein